MVEILDNTVTFNLEDRWEAEYNAPKMIYRYQLVDPENEAEPERKVKLKILEMAIEPIAKDLNFYIKQ